uniref:Uncharacterized protein n=1 Tax=Laticauda laticaudata TaxID=8630 RepID=A0A8C5RKJ7_LATLA
MRLALAAAFSVSGRRSRSEPGGACAVLGTRGRSRWAAATGFLSGAAAAGVAPAEPLLRPPPQRGPGAAMPSDFISLLSADLDLESPKSLYSKESVYDLLPKELQLPPSRELSVASMSQTSGGEVGSPPPGVVAAGFASEAGSVCIKNDL